MSVKRLFASLAVFLASSLPVWASDLIGTWQLPPVAGINQISVGFVVTRPSVQAAPLKVLGTFQIGATAFNRMASPPGSYLVSRNALYYQDPTTGQKLSLTPQPGDIWQIMVSDGIFQFGQNPPCSPAASSAGVWIPVDGQTAPALPASFTSPPVSSRQTLPAPLNVTLTWLP